MNWLHQTFTYTAAGFLQKQTTQEWIDGNWVNSGVLRIRTIQMEM
jgi:hypothetical protein